MDYQILVLDLDGTLTNSKKEISDATYQALIDIQKAGKTLVLASGRPTYGVVPVAAHLKLNEYGGYILSFNGGRITDCRTDKLIFEETLPGSIAESLYNLVMKYPGLDLITYTEDTILSGICPNKYTELESFINHMPIIRLNDFARDIPAQVNKFLITGEPSLVAEAQKELMEHYGTKLNLYCSDPFFLEIMPPGRDKGTSLSHLLKCLNLTTSQAICCGDGYNDIPMIKAAGLGVAMENAQPAVKAAADYITLSNDNDGILHVINKFMN